jgi:sugar phosphate isomerase/epimerase
MQRLEVYQSLWSMELRRPDGMEWPLERKFEMCAEAGYDGLCYDTGTDEAEAVRRLKPLYRRHGLKALFTVFPKSVEGLRPMLALAAEFEAPFVTVIGQVMPLRVEEAVPVVRAWLAQSAETGMPILFETHRNCITNDMYFTLLLMEAVPEMRLCADLSHYVVDREFPCPPRDEDEAMIRRILDRADSFQGRVASREQIQLQLGFPQH